LGITAVDERADNLLGIVRIHLAAEGLDVEGLAGHCLFIIGPPGHSSAQRSEWRFVTGWRSHKDCAITG